MEEMQKPEETHGPKKPPPPHERPRNTGQGAEEALARMKEQQRRDRRHRPHDGHAADAGEAPLARRHA
jgi:hypothetical protein